MDQGFGKEVLTLEDLEEINAKIDEKNTPVEEPVEENEINEEAE